MEEEKEAPSERMPYLELGKEIPNVDDTEESSVIQSANQEVTGEQNRQYQRREPIEVNSRPDFAEQVRSTPLNRLLIVTLSLLVIILLLPRFLLVLGPVVMQILLILRLFLPFFVALGIGWLILQWLRQNSR